MADTGGSYISQLDECEKTLVGKACTGVPIEIRLEALEKTLFGQTGTGSIADRMQAIKQMLAGCAPAVPKVSTATAVPAKAKPHVASAAPATPRQKPVVQPAAAAASVKPVAQSVPSAVKLAPKLDVAAEDKPAASTRPQVAADADGDHSEGRIKDLLRQAIIAHSQGDTAGAKKVFEQVLAIDPNNTDANYNLGAMSEERGDLKTALLCYRMAAASAPEDTDIANAAASVERKLQRSAAQLAAGQASDPDQLKDLARDAGQAFKAGKYDAAISDLQLIADQEPTDASVQYGLARAWRGKGDLNHARRHLTRAISLAPDEQAYVDALQELDKQIQSRQAAGTSADSNPASVADLRHATRGDDDAKQTAARADDSRAGDLKPFTDQGAPRPLIGYAGENVQPGGAGYNGGGLAPIGAFAVSPEAQAVAGTLAAMAALGATSRCYPTYPAYYPVARYGTRSRIARGMLAGGLMSLFARGW
jgi:tetratricopeptide (TPR) repeat protein